MFEDDYDFWEPLLDEEYSGVVMELIDKVKNNVKSEIQVELAKLRKENEELKPVKERLQYLEADYNGKKRLLEREFSKKEDEIRKSTLQDIIDDTKLEYWDIAYRNHQKPKCEKCDSSRYIHYISPQGNKVSEKCNCADYMYVYEPVPCYLQEIIKYDKREGHKVVNLYQYREDKWRNSESLVYVSTNWETDDPRLKKDTEKFIETEKDISKYENYYSLFATKELAQLYCDMKNEAEKEKEKSKKESAQMAALEPLTVPTKSKLTLE